MASVYNVLCGMPVLSTELSIEGYFNNQSVVEEKRIHQPPDSWLCLRPGEEYTLKVKLSRHNKSDLRAHCPHFPRGKDEGWFLVLGSVEMKEVLVMKRVAGVRGNSRSAQQLLFHTPTRLGRMILTLFVMSDCYLGWDQQYDLRLDVEDMGPSLDTSLLETSVSSDTSKLTDTSSSSSSGASKAERFW